MIDKNSPENILIYEISCKTLIDAKVLRIRFDKIDGFNRIYDGPRYLTLFGSEKDNAIYDKIRYLISLKGGITYIFSHYFAKFKVASLDFLPIKKILISHNVITHVKCVLNKDKNHYYYEIFLEKCSYQSAKKTS